MNLAPSYGQSLSEDNFLNFDAPLDMAEIAPTHIDEAGVEDLFDGDQGVNNTEDYVDIHNPSYVAGVQDAMLNVNNYISKYLSINHLEWVSRGWLICALCRFQTSMLFNGPNRG